MLVEVFLNNLPDQKVKYNHNNFKPFSNSSAIIKFRAAENNPQDGDKGLLNIGTSEQLKQCFRKIDLSGLFWHKFHYFW